MPSERGRSWSSFAAGSSTVGPVGTGATMKLAINLPLMIAWAAYGEAFALARDVGMDPARLLDLFADTSGGNNAVRARGPAIAAMLKGRDGGAPTFNIDSGRKDLRTMLAQAKDAGVELPLIERTLASFDEASRNGWGARDNSAMPVYWATRGRG